MEHLILKQRERIRPRFKKTGKIHFSDFFLWGGYKVKALAALKFFLFQKNFLLNWLNYINTHHCRSTYSHGEKCKFKVYRNFFLFCPWQIIIFFFLLYFSHKENTKIPYSSSNLAWLLLLISDLSRSQAFLIGLKSCNPLWQHLHLQFPYKLLLQKQVTASSNGPNLFILFQEQLRK